MKNQLTTLKYQLTFVSIIVACSVCRLKAQPSGVLLIDSTFEMINTIKLADGNYIGTGIYYVGGPSCSIVIKFEPDNDIIWRTPLEPFPATNCRMLYSDSDENINVINGNVFYKINPEGTIISEITYEFEDLGYEPIDGDLGIINFVNADTNSTGIVLLGSGGTGAPDYQNIISITQLSGDGSVLWSYGYEMLNETYVYSIATTDISTNLNYLKIPDDIYHELNVQNATGSILYDIELPDASISTELSELNDGTLFYGTNYAVADIYDVITRVNNDGEIVYNETYPHFMGDSIPLIRGVTQLPSNIVVSCNLLYDIILENYNYIIRHYNETGEIIYESPPILNLAQFSVKYFSSIGDNLVFCGSSLDQGFSLITDSFGHFNKLVIEGKVYYDENNNGVLDLTEIPLPNVLIQSDPDTYLNFSDTEGLYHHDYYFFGTYHQNPVLPEYWDQVTPEFYTVIHDELTTGSTISDMNFGLQYSVPVTDLLCNIEFLNVVRAGFVSKLMFSVNNLGNQIIPSGTVELHFSNFLEYSDGPAYVDLTDTIITYAYPELTPLASQLFFVYLNVPDDLEFGTLLNFSVNVVPPPGDIESENNNDSTSTVSINSYDPNDKKVDPVGVGPNGKIDPSTQYLEYTITFQNIGNAPAINVLVSDTLDASIDPYSIQMLAATHPYRMELVGNNIINWHFDNINLPDSITDPLGSIGSLVMRVKLVPDLPLETQITNTANIYFDYNSPIITNTTINTLTNDLSTINNFELKSPFNVYPNPVGDALNVSTTVTDAILHCTLYTITGVQVGDFNVAVNNGIFTITTQHLPAGTYTIGFKDTSYQNISNVLFIKL